MSSSLMSLTLILFFFSFSFSFLLFAVRYSRRKRRLASTNDEEPRVPLNWTPTATYLSPPPPPSAPLESGDVIAMAEGEQKRRKKRGKKKKSNHEGRGMSDGVDDASCLEIGDEPMQQQQHSKIGESLYPFSSFASTMQRKIKLQYEQLVKSNQAKALTFEQVSQFINCLVDARNELQHKSEIIKRSFKIKKALLFKADRSSFDRLCQQIYKLESEHKRLEEDAAVYNLLQEQLKLSPAYKTMLEIDANMGQKADLDQASEFADISFEELLAQEKKDGFWQRHGKLRTSSG